MIDATLYQPIYLIVVSLLTLIVGRKYNYYTALYKPLKREGDVSCGILIILLTLFIGYRPLSIVFTDMGHYSEIYERFLHGRTFEFTLQQENKIFDNLFVWWGSNRWGYTSFFVFIATIYFVGTYMGIRRLFPHHRLAAYLVFLAAFSTFSFGTNGIKAGSAAALFIWGLGYRDDLKKCVPFLVLSWGFHHSMILPIGAFVLTSFLKNPKWYYWGWFFCFLIALFHISFFAGIFTGLSDEKGTIYLEGALDDGLKRGFRLDFILYSAVPILFGYILEMKKKVKVSAMYQNLIHLYICINGIWMLCMYATYTNRIAYLSWFLYPIVLIYPFLYENWGPNKYVMFKNVMYGQLAFTLFMAFVYY